MTAASSYSRETLLGYPTHWKVSDLGAVQFEHGYDAQLLARIYEKALALYHEVSEKKHLNLRFIRAAHEKIPDIKELMYCQNRLKRLSHLADTDLEPYPVSVISSTITFMGSHARDGTIDWHTDGVPVTELVPLYIAPQTQGGELQIYKNNHEIGMYLLEKGCDLSDEDLIFIKHHAGNSTLAQLMRVLHRTAPITDGFRITLNLNLRSSERPYIDDNTFYYLGADNPDFAWEKELLQDIKERQLPAYLARAATV